MTFVVDQDDFDLAIGAVVRRVGGAVSKQVLVADGVVDLGKVIGHFALEDGREAEASGHCCEGSELVLGLQVVEFANPAASKLVEHRAGADGEDGDVGRGPNLGEHLVEGKFGEGVAAGSNEDDVLSAFDAAGAVERLVECVEHVGVGKARDGERVNTLRNDLLVVGEVREYVGLEVVGHDRDVVVWSQRVKETDRGIAHVVDDIPGVGGELEQHDRGDWGLSDADSVDLLLDAIFQNQEVSTLKAGDELVSLVEDHADIEIDERHVNPDGEGSTIGILDFWLFGGGRWRRLVRLLLSGNNDGSVVDCWATGIRSLGGGWRGLSLGPGAVGGRAEDEDGQQRYGQFLRGGVFDGRGLN